MEHIEIIAKVYRATPSTTVRHYIRHCGLFEGDPVHTMRELMWEGRGVLGKRRGDLSSSMCAYSVFKDAMDFSEPDEERELKRLKARATYIVRKSKRKGVN